MANIIVTGCGRTGTLYMSKVLAKLGISCGHETVFNASLDPTLSHDLLPLILERLKKENITVSWLAAPFLSILPTNIIIWHQVRDPLKSLRCWIQHKMLDCDNETCKFVHKVLPETAKGSDLSRAVQYHLDWNAIIGYQRGHRYFRYQIETITADKLQEMLLFAEYNCSPEAVQWALDSTSRKTGTCGVDFHKDLTWDDVKQSELGSELEYMAREYGYKYDY